VPALPLVDADVHALALRIDVDREERAREHPVCAYFAVCSQLWRRGRIASMATYADAA